MKNSTIISDFTFIGSGISTSFTIINFLNLIEKNKNLEKITIDVIDKYSEFNTGIPYSSRSGFSTLLITSLKNFLPEIERKNFITWLNSNKTWLLNEFKKEGGPLSQQWISNHQIQINTNDWEDLFLPRRFFGMYIDQRIKNKIEKFGNKIDVRYFIGEAVDLSKNDGIFNIHLLDKNVLKTKKIILSVGSLPVKKLWKDNDILLEDNLMFVNTPYHPDLHATLNRINIFLEERKSRNLNTNTLIIGANASALELLYKLNDVVNSDKNKIDNFVFLSTLGRIPDSEIDEKRKKEFVAVNLEHLQKGGSLTADIIADAAFKDIKLSDDISLGAASTVDKISKAFGSLLSKLDYIELQRFACYFGNQIGKLQRCAGTHYTNTITDLLNQNRFEHISGRFLDLINDGNKGYTLKYTDTKTKTEKLFDKNFHLILNCIGGMDLTDDAIPELHKNLLRKGFCEVNDSKIGFKVNDSLEASKDLHIMGPMLGGNVINKNAVWHVEHCGRIIWLSGMLSKTLYDSVSNKNQKHSESLKITKSKGINFEVITNKTDWDTLLKDIGSYDCYHTYDYHQLAASNGERPVILKYTEHDIIIGLPLLIRDIYSTIFKDATSVYGYAGPISKGVNNEFNNSTFMIKIKNYFNENNIISVFSRINPLINNSHKILQGNGELCSSGKIVNINLALGLDEQRKNYRSRLKSQINKARREYTVAIGTTDSHLDKFIELYYENMDKVDAKKYYYFNKSYFRKLINSNDFKTTLLFVIDNDSEEMIGASLFMTTNNIVQYHLSGTKNEFSKLNPTKLLIDEMRNIATEQGLEFFNLGGGLGGADNDSLFYFKSSFSKEFKEFFIWKWITNKKIYDELCLNKEKINKEDYFPLYRTIEDINVQM